MDKGIDFMCLTETWQQPEVYSALNEVCPPGYSYLEKARSTGRGGGLAIIHRNALELSPLPLPVLSSFECLGFKCKPPPSTDMTSHLPASQTQLSFHPRDARPSHYTLRYLCKHYNTR